MRAGLKTAGIALHLVLVRKQTNKYIRILYWRLLSDGNKKQEKTNVGKPPDLYTIHTGNC